MYILSRIINLFNENYISISDIQFNLLDIMEHTITSEQYPSSMAAIIQSLKCRFSDTNLHNAIEFVERQNGD